MTYMQRESLCNAIVRTVVLVAHAFLPNSSAACKCLLLLLACVLSSSPCVMCAALATRPPKSAVGVLTEPALRKPRYRCDEIHDVRHYVCIPLKIHMHPHPHHHHPAPLSRNAFYTRSKKPVAVILNKEDAGLQVTPEEVIDDLGLSSRRDAKVINMPRYTKHAVR